MKKYLLSGACIALLAACNPAAETGSSDQATMTSDAPQDAQLGDWGIETANISETVSPGDDFFRYVNEGWLATAEIQPGFSSNGSFRELRQVSEDRINTIIAELRETGGEPGTPEQQVGDLYTSYMDLDRIEELGLTPIQGDIDDALQLSSYSELARLMGSPGHGSVFGGGVSIDSGDPTRYLYHMSQGGLSLGNRDYYLREDERQEEFRVAYVTYLTTLFEMAGIDNARGRAEDVMALETAIAEIHWTPVQSRDSVATYNLMTREELHAYAPGFDWDAFLEADMVGGENEFVLRQNTAMQQIAAMIETVPLETWQSYMAINVINGATGNLPDAYGQLSFEFYSGTLRGVEERRPRDRRAVQRINGSMGEPLGQIYANRHFPPEYKAQMEELVEYLGRALAERIETLEWMDDETRVQALYKLENFTPKIGYPDVWRDFSDLEIRPDDLHGNTRRIGNWFRTYSRSRLGGPIRDWEWGMNPQTVNAYYSRSRNEIVFPAAILQPPFFDPNADAAVNFGGIGGVIGHEMGHGFDDQGSRSDGDGVLRNWWSDASREAFEARTGMIVAQYSEFSPLEGLNVNGALTLGENIGDIGGLSMAYRAYQLYLEDHPEENVTLGGFTPDQRIFLGWGQVWRYMFTDDALRARLIGGPHSPPRYRVNGTLRNMDIWYEAFDVTEDNDLYLPPEERVSIW
ncbi:MAG: M13 family metallopeptidase [Maricaulis sp.]|jgi:putative endopeptidase|nr:M13 family metallopeptidase [Maricaulis sp.]MDG2043604.1 M13 family metallopeptidase [Maricaulis sp.]